MRVRAKVKMPECFNDMHFIDSLKGAELSKRQYLFGWLALFSFFAFGRPFPMICDHSTITSKSFVY